MNVIQKNATVSTVESENPSGEFEVVLSTEDLDRDKENLWADEWKTPLPAKIHIDGDHGRSLDKTVGSAVPRIDGNRMVAKGTFAGTPYAQMVRQLVNEGHVNSMSVTYSESKNQKDNGVQRELLNAAFVAIPANPEAVVLSSKSAKTTPDNKAAEVGTMDSLTLMELVAKAAGGKVNARAVKHDTMVQAVHDAASHLGAQCCETIDYQPGVDPGLKAAGGLSASGNNPAVKHDAMTQAIHDAAWHLGAQCANEIAADPGGDEGANKSADKSSSAKDAGKPQETEESTAPTAKAAGTAEESADTAAHAKAKELEKARGLAFLISKNTKEDC